MSDGGSCILKKYFNERVFDIAFQNQHSNATELRSLRYLSAIKTVKGIDSCLESLPSRHHRRIYALAMLNCPSAYIKRLENRKECVLCSEDVQDVFVHRVFNCRRLTNERSFQNRTWYENVLATPQCERPLLLRRKFQTKEVVFDVRKIFQN